MKRVRTTATWLGSVLVAGIWACSSAPPPEPPPLAPETTAAKPAAEPAAKPEAKAEAQPKKKTLKPQLPTLADMKRPKAPAGLEKVAGMLAKKGWAEAKDALNEQITELRRKGTLDVKVQAHAMLGLAHAMLEEGPDADRAYRRVISFANRPERQVKQETKDEAQVEARLATVMHGIGEALFHLAEKRRAKLGTIAFPVYDGTGEPEEMKKHFKRKVKLWVGRKQRAVDRARGEFDKIAALKPVPGPWVVAAASRGGAMYAGLAYECLEESTPQLFEQKGDSSVKKPSAEPEPAAAKPAGDAGAPAKAKPAEVFYTFKELRELYDTAAHEQCDALVDLAKEKYGECQNLASTHGQKGAFAKSCDDWLAGAP